MSKIVVTMTRTNRAWYAHPALLGEEEARRLYGREELGFHCLIENERGDRTPMDGEVYLRWMDISGKETPHLQVFDDSWNLLPIISPLLSKAQATLNEDNRSADAIEEFMLDQGVEDVTELEPKKEETLNRFRQAVELYNQEKGLAGSSAKRPGM